VRVVREEAKLSERRACGLIGMHRGSWRYQRRERDEGALRARLRELAAERPRFGYRRLYIFLRREKTVDGTLRWRVNHKRVYRLYREEGLAMQRTKRKRECRWRFRREPMNCGRWTTRMTNWPAGGNSGR
jgi:putative transposase